MVNGAELSLPITLNVSGVLISGHMVSGHKYFEGFANDLKNGMYNIKEENAEKFISPFRKLGDIYSTDKREHEDEPDQPRSLPKFIHLKDARIFHPNSQPIPANRGVWWRGRLEAIDGFILGILSLDPQSPKP